MNGKYLGLALATVGIWAAVGVVALAGVTSDMVGLVSVMAAGATFFMFLFTS